MKGILSLRWKSGRGKAKKFACFARRLFFPPKPKILDQTLAVMELVDRVVPSSPLRLVVTLPVFLLFFFLRFLGFVSLGAAER